MKPIETFQREAPPVLPNDPIVIEGIDGRIYSGKTLTLALEEMRKGSWGMPAKNLKGYMRQVAKRVLGWNKIHIRTSGVRVFAEDLARIGVITIHVQK